MEEYLNSAVVWFGIGLVFLLLEFVLPGFILFFFGIGAWIVAILTLFIDVSLNVQLLVFLGSSLVTVLLFRNWVKNKFDINQRSPQHLEEEYVGKFAMAETAIKPGHNGKVEFKGASWDASSDDYIEAGEQVLIIETRSILLIVKSTQPLL